MLSGIWVPREITCQTVYRFPAPWGDKMDKLLNDAPLLCGGFVHLACLCDTLGPATKMGGHPPVWAGVQGAPHLPVKGRFHPDQNPFCFPALSCCRQQLL